MKSTFLMAGQVLKEFEHESNVNVTSAARNSSKLMETEQNFFCS